MAFSNLFLSTSFPEQALYFYIKKTFSQAENRYFFKNGKKLLEADIFIPEINVAIEYDGFFFHNSKKTIDEKKNLFLKNKNIQLIRIRENMKNEKLPTLITHGCHIIERSDPSSVYSLEKTILDTFNFIEKKFKIKGNFVKIDVTNDQTEIHKSFERWTIEKSIVTTHPNIAKQWHKKLNDPLKPEHVTYGSKTVVWWQCSKDSSHVFQAPVASKVINDGCRYCSNKAVRKPLSLTNNLAVDNPTLSAQWHPELNGSLTPSDVTPSSNENVWWQCPDDSEHVWQEVIGNRNRDKTNCNCPYCSGRRTTDKTSLRALFPEIASEWNEELNGNLTPDDVTARASRYVWWKCRVDSSHAPWEAIIFERTDGNGKCPTCQSFSVTHPHLLLEWNNKENTKRKLDPKVLTYGSGSPASWICKDCSHVFDMKIGHKSEGRTCPKCNKKRKPVPVERSLSYRFPDVAKEWDYEKNVGLTPSDVFGGSSDSAYWICSKNNDHKWKARISNRTSKLKRGCPHCNGGVKK